jgi:hypothetical protein
MTDKNTLIASNDSQIVPNQTKPAIYNTLPAKRRIYYVDSNGCVIFELSEALSAKESNLHNS